MFTKKDFELQAEVLGNHVIPMCVYSEKLITEGTSSLYWLDAGTSRRWDINKVNEYLTLGNFLVVKFQENTAFDLYRFNARICQWFIKWTEINGSEYLLWDMPGMELTGNKPQREGAFRVLAQ